MTAQANAAAQAPLSEADRQRMVLCGKGWDRVEAEGCADCLAHLYGWRGMHVHPLRTLRGGYRTGTGGDLGEGWPDLFLAHPRRGVLAVEMKRRASDKPTPAQRRVLDWLRTAGVPTLVVHDPLDRRLTAALAGRTAGYRVVPDPRT